MLQQYAGKSSHGLYCIAQVHCTCVHVYMYAFLDVYVYKKLTENKATGVILILHV